MYAPGVCKIQQVLSLPAASYSDALPASNSPEVHYTKPDC